jgi:glycosyltransferase involved in cell wall biosynthesis
VSQPIRVLFHVDSLTIGGLEKKVTRLALGLDRRRFEPIVSYSWEWGPLAGELQRGGVQVEQIVPRAPGRAGANEAVERIRDLAPQIFHSFSCRQNADDVWAAREAKAPVIISSRGNLRHWAPSGPARNWEFDRNAMTQFVTACCEATAQVASAAEGIHPAKLAVIYNGVEIPEPANGPSIREELGIPASAFLAGYAARYRPLKAHETLLRAWAKVVAARPDAYLACCGEDEGDRLERLRELVCHLSLAPNVLLLGSRQDMDSFYRGLDLYVHPSSAEGLSNAILEAMSHGLPVAATSVGGTGEAIEDGVSGILVPASDPRALAEAVLELAAAPEVRHALGHAARDRVCRRFSMDRMVQGYESLYVRAIEKRRLETPPPAAPLFTGTEGSPALDDLTVFVTTIGDEENFADCMAHLRAQTVRCRLDVIDHVAPMSAAFAQMHQRCATPYFVQVDEDMLLYPQALARLHELILQSDANVPMVCAPLWDCDVERPILGVKIYRHEIVKRFPYRDTLSCEVTQMQQMSAAGHHSLVLSAEEEDAVCLGEHGKHYTPKSIFVRWQRLFHKRNDRGNLTWLDPWPARLLERYIKTRDPLHLHAALGAIAGITGRADGDRELDWRDTDAGWQRLQYYFHAPESSVPVGWETTRAITPRASIVIPLLRQRDAWLDQAVRSAVTQTAPCEVIVVTSRETPESNRGVLREIAANHKNLRVLFRDLPAAYAATLNFGMRAARTERIGLLLTDDWLEPECVAECLAHSADIVSTSHNTWHADGLTPVTGAARRLSMAKFHAKATLEAKAAYVTHFFLFQRAALQRAGWVDESVGDFPGVDDYHLVWTMLEQGAETAIVERSLYNYRDHDGERLTLADPERAVENLGKILRKHGLEEPELSRVITTHKRWFGKPLYAVLAERAAPA